MSITCGAFEAFTFGNQKYAELFGNEIIQSIPPGGVYFGGTDPGRFIVTALQKSQVNGDPFFTLTQNALAGGFYLFKINHQPVPQLSENVIRQDQQYWPHLMAPMIGDWLKTDTSLPEITAFAEKIRHHDFSGFTGDRAFVQNDYSRKMFSAARAHIADLYVWRMNQATATDEKDRMAHAADFAFRQALALCPYHQEAAKAYEDFLKSQNRSSDADLIHGMAVRFPSS